MLDPVEVDPDGDVRGPVADTQRWVARWVIRRQRRMTLERGQELR
ncbi:hypothetical protein [Saccharopolyspora erythraea]|nr:hypothetical protein [Saccharopolyspora erythraea]